MTYIRAGTALHCTAGHYIARLARDITSLDVLKADSFEDVQGPAMRPHDRFGLCQCGAWWARFGSLHTSDGWKPSLSKECLAEIEAWNAGAIQRGTSGIVRHGLDPAGRADLLPMAESWHRWQAVADRGAGESGHARDFGFTLAIGADRVTMDAEERGGIGIV